MGAIVHKLALVMAKAQTRPPRARRRTQAVRSARLLWASLALFALVAAIVSAGQRYFYCPTMNQSAFSACCDKNDAATAQADVTDGPAIAEHAGCCEARVLEANAPYSSQRGAAPAVFAPLVAILPALFSLDALALVDEPHAFAFAIREGPTPREARAALQVYLC